MPHPSGGGTVPFQRDEKYAAEVESVFGEYLATFVSEPSGQIRADVFRKGRRVEAHVSFPTGIDASDVTEPYVSALWEYARKEGVADRFQLILS
jgi:hypothetical protein